MSMILDNKIYLNDLEKICKLDYNWLIFKDKTILIAGARGLIGSFVIDEIMFLNETRKLNCKIIAIGRNKKTLIQRFGKYSNNDNFKIYEMDINNQIKISENVDYIIDGASNTHPISYSTDPIGTIITNVIGLNNLLNLAVEKKVKRFIFLSSVEIYGENTKGNVPLKEDDFGYIDCNTLRAGYPESKRLGEALCQAYISKYSLDIVIARISRVYGPTILSNDSKAISQFINKAVNDEDIVLKSEGNQYYSYLYVGDVVSAILLLLINGEKGQAYNVASESSNIKLKDLATKIANYVGKKVIFEIPDAVEKKGYSTATVAIIDNDKLKKIGFISSTTIDDGIKNTIEILKGTRN